jgi:DNA-binding response OmpR family regulator
VRVNIRGHVCLVGSALCRNWPLVQRLEGSHALTLLHELSSHDMRLIEVADVLALDCRERGAAGTQELVTSLRRATDAPIVVLDGGLRPAEVALLVSAGAQDYFAEPFNVTLIAERLEHLADSSRSRRERLVEGRR